MNKIKFLIMTLFLVTGHLLATVPGINIKEILEEDLKTNYLASLEKIWGDCGSTPESC